MINQNAGFNPNFNPNVNQNVPFYDPQQTQMRSPGPLSMVAENPPFMNGFPGKLISNVNEITPNEIRMDGTVSLFPTKDYSQIYAKAWNSNGHIDTVKYVPESSMPDVNKDIIKRLERIEKLIRGNLKTANIQRKENNDELPINE